MPTTDLRRDLVQADLAMRDASYVAALAPALGRLTRLWFRSEVRGIEHVPREGGALLVSNHSGGLLAMDAPIIAAAFVEAFGADRPLYLQARERFFGGVAGPVLRRCGLLPANPENTAAVLDAGGVTLVFPGGDHDAFRPSTRANVVDFAGHTDYVGTALRSGVPIVPVVSIGGHEDQLHLGRGELLARTLRLDRLLGTPYLPLSFGAPFGLSAGLPVNVPLPTKIVTQVLAPVDVAAELGADPDPTEVDAVIRGRMQDALDELARKRRFPVLG